MTEQLPSTEALAVADKVYIWGLNRGAVEIDALCAQRVSAAIREYQAVVTAQPSPSYHGEADMTSAPVPLAEQIAAVRRVLDVMDHHTVFEDVISPTRRDGLRAVLATLQQHERAMAALREIVEHKGGPTATALVQIAQAALNTVAKGNSNVK